MGDLISGKSGRISTPAQDMEGHKKKLRKKYLSKRAHLTWQEIKAAGIGVLMQLIELNIFSNYSAILTYMPANGEVDTTPLINYCLTRDIPVAVPRVDGKSMDFYLIRSYDDLHEGTFGIMEPKRHCAPAAYSNSFMTVPGIAFDRRGGRLGYGGGYYDRFLSAGHDIYTCGIAYEFQICQRLPQTGHDILLNAAMTPNRMMEF